MALLFFARLAGRGSVLPHHRRLSGRHHAVQANIAELVRRQAAETQFERLRGLRQQRVCAGDRLSQASAVSGLPVAASSWPHSTTALKAGSLA